MAIWFITTGGKELANIATLISFSLLIVDSLGIRTIKRKIGRFHWIPCHRNIRSMGIHFRKPAYQVQLENGSTVSDLRYVSHTIFQGKAPLEGLLATYVEAEEEAETLDITMEDSLNGLKVILRYTVFEQFNGITRSVRFVNEGSQSIKLLSALSVSVDFRDSNYDFLHLHGAHVKERHI